MATQNRSTPNPIVTAITVDAPALDSAIPLSPLAGDRFVHYANAQLADPASVELLGRRAAEFAAIINADLEFPFHAALRDGQIALSYAGDKNPGAALKDISDGITRIYKVFNQNQPLEQNNKFALSMVFQQALYEAYRASGLDTGPHTEYIKRGC